MGKELDMKREPKDNTILYINVALVVSIAFVLIFIIRPFFVSSGKGAIAGPKVKSAPVVSKKAARSIYDIDKVKRSLPGATPDKTVSSDLEEMYKNSDKTDVGGNMVEAWRQVKPEDKAKLSDGFDKQIIAAQETLEKDPGNKHAKNLLYITERIKEMSASGFNYKFKNKK
jgi:hypothetical protein